MKTYSAQKADLPVVQEATTPPKLTPQKRTSGCQNTKATDATLSSSGVESKTNVLCKSTADGKKLENPHSLKSNEMAECSLRSQAKKSSSCQRTRFRTRILGRCSLWKCTSGPSLHK